MKIQFIIWFSFLFSILTLFFQSCNDDEMNESQEQIISYDGCCATEPINAILDTGAVYIPNLITPNGDGFNDGLGIHCGLGIEVVKSFIIKDQSNQVVHSAVNVPATPYPDNSIRWRAKDSDGNVLLGLFDVEVVVTTLLGSTEVFTLKVCSHLCDGEAPIIENGAINCATGSNHNGGGGYDNNLPINEPFCF